MLKIAFAMIFLTGAVQVASQDIQSQSQIPPGVESNRLETPVSDPDTNSDFDDDPRLVQGVEGDAQLFRDPARPSTPKPMHAVGYEVNGCSLLVMTDGSLMRPLREDKSQAVTFIPAQ